MSSLEGIHSRVGNLRDLPVVGADVERKSIYPVTLSEVDIVRPRLLGVRSSVADDVMREDIFGVCATLELRGCTSSYEEAGEREGSRQ